MWSIERVLLGNARKDSENVNRQVHVTFTKEDAWQLVLELKTFSLKLTLKIYSTCLSIIHLSAKLW